MAGVKKGSKRGPYRKRLNEGYRGLLISLMMTGGIVTGHGIELVGGKKSEYIRKQLTSMQSEIDPSNGKPLCRSVRIDNHYKASYLTSFDKNTDEYFDEIAQKNIDRLLKRKSDPTGLERGIGIADSMAFMKRMGIPSLVGEKSDYYAPEICDGYYLWDEIKMMTAIAFGKIAEDIKLSVFAPTRAVGMLLLHKHFYPTYFVNKTRLKWKQVDEVKMLAQTREMIDRRGMAYLNNSECIIIARDEDVFTRMLSDKHRDEKKKREYKDSYNLFMAADVVYESIYAFPFKSEAEELFSLIRERQDWKKILMDRFGGKGAAFTNRVSCDFEKDGEYVCLFCIPDLKKFDRFVLGCKVQYLTYRFKVICFGWQESFVRSALSEEQCEIEVVSLN